MREPPPPSLQSHRSVEERNPPPPAALKVARASGVKSSETARLVTLPSPLHVHSFTPPSPPSLPPLPPSLINALAPSPMAG
jgi:hypothetical protein